MVSVDEARGKVTEAEVALATATEAFEEHVKRNRMAEALSAAEAVRIATTAVTKARDAVTRLEFESRAEEREAASVALKGALDALIASEVWGTAKSLGINGFIVAVGAEGGLNITIRTIHEKATGAKRGPKEGTGTGGTKGRLVFLVEGNEYTSRELLESFGEAQFGAEWLAKVWERQAAGGGFDAPVKQLAKKLDAKLMKKVEGELVEVA